MEQAPSPDKAANWSSIFFKASVAVAIYFSVFFVSVELWGKGHGLSSFLRLFTIPGILVLAVCFVMNAIRSLNARKDLRKQYRWGLLICLLPIALLLVPLTFA